MFSRASGLMINGGTFNATTTTTNISQSKRGIDLLMEYVAIDAMHDSDELYDAPKCHPRTRVAVLDDIINWVIECPADSKAQDDFIMWLFGAAGAGKSAIAKTIAELAAEKGLLIGSFFFSRTSTTRNNKSRLIPTLAYQMTVSIPGTRDYIEEAIERDRAIFRKNIQAQIDTLLIKPFQSASTEIIPFPKLIIIDGLDECNDSKAQVAILDAISRSFTKHKLLITCLFVSRPETDIVSSFNGREPLKSVHRRLALDYNYCPDDDIHRFFSDKFEEIRGTHRLRSTIPVYWPTEEALDTLVKKSSGQFIYAATVIRYVQSNRHRPVERLNIILEISPPGTINPFAELDAVYKQILTSVEDIQLTLRVLRLCISSPRHCLTYDLQNYQVSEHFLSLEEGNIDLALIGLASIISYDESSGEVKILHASFVDFLSDKRRSDEFYIDMASARTDFACRTLQFFKRPDRIQAGDPILLSWGIGQDGFIFNDQLRKKILTFDLDSFFTVAIEYPSPYRKATCNDMIWILAILLGMYNGNLHLVDQGALNLRHHSGCFHAELSDMIMSCYVDSDGDRLGLSSAALPCMGFLSNPPKYSETSGNVTPGQGIHCDNWKATYRMAFKMLCELLERANTSPELIQFMTDHNINTTVHKNVHLTDVWRLKACIIDFLSHGGVCVNRRIVSAIRRARALSVTDTSGQSETSEENDWHMYESEDESEDYGSDMSVADMTT